MSTRPAPHPSPRMPALATLALVAGMIAIWVFSHPYRGILHDGILYLAQALLRTRPETFSRDLFFAYGSQDSYTLFSTPYAFFIGLLGIGGAAKSLLLLAQASFLAATALLLSRLFPNRIFWLCLACVLCMPSHYGAMQVFAYGETFLTARSFAEPLTLLGLWFLLGGRLLAAMACALAAALLHPLIALAGMLAGWAYLSLAHPRVWLLGFASLAAPLLAVAGIAPFDSLLQSYDPEWLNIVMNRTSFVFPSRWEFADWSQIALDTAILGLAASLRQGALRRLYLAVILAAWVGILTSVVGADLMHNVLLTGLQTWRCHWLMHLLAMASLPWLVLHAWAHRPAGVAIAGLLVGAALAARFPGGAGALALAMLLWLRPGTASQLAAGLQRAIALAGLAAASMGMAYLLTDRQSLLASLTGDAAQAWALAAAGTPLFALATTGLALAWSGAHPRRVLLAASCVLALALASWDLRSNWWRFMEDGNHREHPFLEAVGVHQQVYWFNEILAPWLVLNRPAYYSLGHGSGVLFNRSTAIEYDRRQELLNPIEAQAGTCRLMNLLGMADGPCEISLAAVQEVCTNARDLDYLVIENSIEKRTGRVWTFAGRDGQGARTFYLYGCADFRGA